MNFPFNFKISDMPFGMGNAKNANLGQDTLGQDTLEKEVIITDPNELIRYYNAPTINRTITLSGTSGSLEIVFHDEDTFVIEFDTDLETTVFNFFNVIPEYDSQNRMYGFWQLFTSTVQISDNTFTLTGPINRLTNIVISNVTGDLNAVTDDGVLTDDLNKGVELLPLLESGNYYEISSVEVKIIKTAVWDSFSKFTNSEFSPTSNNTVFNNNPDPDPLIGDMPAYDGAVTTAGNDNIIITVTNAGKNDTSPLDRYEDQSILNESMVINYGFRNIILKGRIGELGTPVTPIIYRTGGNIQLNDTGSKTYGFNINQKNVLLFIGFKNNLNFSEPDTPGPYEYDNGVGEIKVKVKYKIIEE